jgi:hypothetical protein
MGSTSCAPAAMESFLCVLRMRLLSLLKGSE